MDNGLNMSQFGNALLPVLDAAQSKHCDAFTIENEPISSNDLMERAARNLYNALKKEISADKKIHVVCGPGNNGGDGLCMARMMIADGYKVKISLCIFDKKQSAENALQEQLIEKFAPQFLHHVQNEGQFVCGNEDMIVDALFGTGLTSALENPWDGVVKSMNESGKEIYSLDVPSGLFDTGIQNSAPYVFAKKTFTIQAPKPSFFYPENKIDFCIVNAGIDIHQETTETFFLSPQKPFQAQILNLLPPKPKFSHKDTFGHALLVGGNTGMHGAIALSVDACIKAGSGLTTVLAPAGARLYLGNFSKAMHWPHKLTQENALAFDLANYTTLAIGPGLGQDPETRDFMLALLKKWQKPVLLDADALNLLASDAKLWQYVLPGSIITPHPGEFRRLFGDSPNSKERFALARKMAMEKQIFILAKDTYSALFTPDGKTYFNGSGGPWLAQGGSGDTLTGLVAGLWARTGQAFPAALMGMYMAGLEQNQNFVN